MATFKPGDRVWVKTQKHGWQPGVLISYFVISDHYGVRMDDQNRWPERLGWAIDPPRLRHSPPTNRELAIQDYVNEELYGQTPA